MTGTAWMIGLVTIVSGWLLYKGLLYLLRVDVAGGRALAQRLKLALKQLAAPLALLGITFCLLLILPLLRVAPAGLEMLSHGGRVFLIGAGAWLGVRLIALGRELVLQRYDIQAADNLEARRVVTQIRVIERLLSVAFVLIAFAMVLMSFDRLRQVGVSLMASAGVIGIIIGFAAQKSIATVLAGLQIALTQPIRMDDVVIVEGEWGRIEEITLTYVVVHIWDHRRLILPITYFIDNPFQNWTRTSADILGTVFVYTDYTVPIETVRKKLHEILKTTPLWDEKAWCLQVTNSTDRAVELRALMSARTSGEAWDLRCMVREQLISWLQEAYPQHLPRARVELDRQGDGGAHA